MVAAGGASDLIYLPRKDRELALRVVDALLTQDYVSGLFVDDDLGSIPGTLPMSAINLVGKAVTPRPSIVVNFRSFSTGGTEPLMSTAVVSDTELQQGQGMHGSFSRSETLTFMAAIGPDFKRGYIDDLPVSNVDIGRTIAHILGVVLPSRGSLMGRVVTESMPGGAIPIAVSHCKQSLPGAGDLRTTLLYEQVGETRYFGAAGFPGRTVGLTKA